MLKVRSDAVIVRYTYLSRYVDELFQGFNLGAPYPAVLVQCQKGEKLHHACLRTHLEVLRLMVNQCTEMHQAQLQALEAGIVAASETVPTAQELLGATQDASLMMGAKRGGFWRQLLRLLPQTEDGHYGSALLVSSLSYFKTLCALPPEELNQPWPQGRSFEGIVKRLPIWEPGERISELTIEGFKWRAVGPSELHDEVFELVGTINYGSLGLASGAFKLFNQDKSTAEEGEFNAGLVTDTFRLELYQDYKAKFPAGSFTLDLLSGEFEGPFSVCYDIDMLFIMGYHAVLLEQVYSILRATQHKPTYKRLCPYEPGSYLAISGSYAAGEVQTQKRHYLGPYHRPREHSYWEDFSYLGWFRP